MIALPLADLPTIDLGVPDPAWLTLPLAFILIPLAGLLIGLLYVGQRRLASAGTVALLLIVRLMLLLLLAILLLQPSLKWTRTRTSAGTLWIVLDHSPSMLSTDPQSTPDERMHWAESLGYLPDSRPLKPDYYRALLGAISGEAAALQTYPGDAAAGGSERDAIALYIRRFEHWRESLKELREALEREKSELDRLPPSMSGGKVIDALKNAGDFASAGLSAARTAPTLRDASRSISWTTVLLSLSYADKFLEGISLPADSRFLTSHATDATVRNALAQVENVPRADLADGFLNGPTARASKHLPELLEKYNLRVAGFSDKAQALGAADSENLRLMLKSALTVDGQATSMDSALQLISEQIATDEPASVLIISDGRNNTGNDPSFPARSLAARNVRVFGLLVGSHAVSPDAAIEQIDAPDWVFRGDTVRAQARLRLDGLKGRTATVELLKGDQVINRRSVLSTQDQFTSVVEFSDKPAETERAVEYQIRVQEQPGEVNTQNNSSTFRVAIKKDKLYALVIEDRPRWEFRYLSAALTRDPRLKVQTVLLNPAIVAGVAPPEPVRASPSNPRDDAQLLPLTREEWEAFDLIFLGDLAPGTLSNQTQQFIASAVRDKGATLVTIAGQNSMPARYANSPLAELLPVTFNSQWTPEVIERQMVEGFRPTLAPEAESGVSVLARLDGDPARNADLWAHVPLWYWHSPYTQAKPAAAVIWTIGELAPARPGVAPQATDSLAAIAESRKHALLSTMFVGLGRSLYLASDQSWRFRQVYGANVHDRFWGQILRWAAGSDLPAGGKFVRFGANQPLYNQDQSAIITARILKEDLSPYTGLTFSAVARPLRPAGSQPANSSSATVEGRFVESAESPGYYSATIGGLPVGEVEISLRGPEVERLLNNDPTVTQRTLIVKVVPQTNAERRNMNTDPELLARVTRAGGGFSVDAPYADILLTHLPEIQRTEVSHLQLGFFTDPHAKGTLYAHWAFLVIFGLLITSEWLLRKRAGLV